MQLQLASRPVIDRVSITCSLPKDNRITICKLDGPGCIRHISVVLKHSKRIVMSSRKVIMRIYFDQEPTPYVESPVGDFFGVMHGEDFYDLNTHYLSAKGLNGYNAYFPMPFAESAQFEFEAGLEDNRLYLIIEWHRYPDQEFSEKRRFCARWRRENPTERYGDDYLILDADGPGQLLGFVYGVRLLDDTDRWSHGGSDNIYVDGEDKYPAFIRGIGGEDCFGAGYGGNLHPVDVHLHAGIPYYTHEDVGTSRPAPRVVGYRFYDSERIEFQKSIQFRFGCMSNDICSTAYWYQQGPVRVFSGIPPFEKMLPGTECSRQDGNLELPSSGQWQVAGPFKSSDDPSLDDKHSLSCGLNEHNWMPRNAHHGFIDFNHCWRPQVKGVGTHFRNHFALARCVLISEAAAKAKIRIAWDDHLFMILNNSNSIDFGNNTFFRSKTIEVSLQKGDNELIIKLSNTSGLNHGGWALAFLATLEDGTILQPQIPSRWNELSR